MLPIFNSWALRVGPELPALTFALLGTLAAWRASQSKGERLLWWVGAGLFLGAGSWFSSATIPILAGVLLTALSGPKQRRTGQRDRERALGGPEVDREQHRHCARDEKRSQDDVDGRDGDSVPVSDAHERRDGRA